MPESRLQRTREAYTRSRDTLLIVCVTLTLAIVVSWIGVALWVAYAR